MTHRAALESEIELVVQQAFTDKPEDRLREMLSELTSGGFAPIDFPIRGGWKQCMEL